MVAGTVRPWVAVAWAGLTTLAAAAALAADPDAAGSGAARAVHAAAAVGVALVLARLLQHHLVRRVGGITGDVLGALSEVTTTVVVLVLALSP